MTQNVAPFSLTEGRARNSFRNPRPDVLGSLPIPRTLASKIAKPLSGRFTSAASSAERYSESEAKSHSPGPEGASTNPPARARSTDSAAVRAERGTPRKRTGSGFRGGFRMEFKWVGNLVCQIPSTLLHPAGFEFPDLTGHLGKVGCLEDREFQSPGSIQKTSHQQIGSEKIEGASQG